MEIRITGCQSVKFNEFIYKNRIFSSLIDLFEEMKNLTSCSVCFVKLFRDSGKVH